ncbi:hypothetical protein F0M41_23935 [Salmonella enterica subsp. enterica]|nr:hypothetical protein [Salmonella enterica subsp. enterica serovar Typhimurium]ECR2294755.1 hypothetical protein [Salmonella enterica subsp. enterica]MJZ27935.1 hypothetical protein [Escherichia coli]PJM10129.1 hypothetical protein CU494_19095 [Salmonella enterica subsp. enterica serovar Typhimurium]
MGFVLMLAFRSGRGCYHLLPSCEKCLLIQINVIFLHAGLPTQMHGLFSVLTIPGRRFNQGVV